jgi:thiamine biosynthesis lipoprotein
VELLRQAGISHSLVDMGETRAIGDHPDGRAWDVAIADPDRPGHRVGIVPLIDRALATSGPYGFRFDGRGGCNHLFDPATGHCAARYRSVSVRARTATEADALSTAFCVMPPEGIRAAAARVGAELVNIVDEAGIVSQFASSQG